MLRVTAQTLFLFYSVVDVINNPVNLASGKPGFCLNHDNLAQNALTLAQTHRVKSILN